jgi:hypothetical protein
MLVFKGCCLKREFTKMPFPHDRFTAYLLFRAQKEIRILFFRSICDRFRGNVGKAEKSEKTPILFRGCTTGFLYGEGRVKLLMICVKPKDSFCLGEILKRCPVEKKKM